METQPSVCDIAHMRHRQALMWRNLWSILTYVFGAFLIGFLVVSIVFFARTDWFPGLLTTVSAIVDGVAIKWVVARRADAVKEEKEAYDDVKQACPNTAKADALRARWRL